MKVAADQNCFVCGSDNRIGLNVNFDIDNARNKSEAVVSISENYQGWQGIVHGGIISALLDEAAIYACRPLSMYAVTANLNVRYLKPVPTNCEVKVQAEVVSANRKVAEVKSGLWLDNVLLSEAQVKVIFTNYQEGQS